MCKDGLGLECITNDQNDDWFSHRLSDGKVILYLSCATDTERNPRNENFELRLFSLEDHNSQKLLLFFDGQGSINVLSWKKNGINFAYLYVLDDA